MTRSPAPPRPTRRLFKGLALACCALAAPAAAHEFWLMPETFEPRIGVSFGIRLFVGDGFEKGQAYPRNPNHVSEFKAFSSEVAEIDGRPGADPAGRFTATEPGVLALLYRSLSSRLTLDAGPFESYLRKEGLEHVSRLRATAGETASPAREAFSRCAKSLLQVTGDQPGGRATAWDRRVGLDLEIVPLRSPFTSEGGGELPVLVLWRGEPLPDAKVRAFVRGHPDATVGIRTGDDGIAILSLETPGVWMLSTVHMERAAPDGDVDWQSTWSSLTFQTTP